ncbi:lipase family protein [Mycolicibacterium sp. 050158]|uniref:lipase family protein n=1 Tax=Mycolicibacterium sp. 050158 TaxID=3090602 RepID=UPI00299E41DC|nr:lipase family protein [Mycolicibacterium sp. 050158]MDX1891922.1 lipase family protein [Mycolicibacterium sp. 050158]
MRATGTGICVLAVTALVLAACSTHPAPGPPQPGPPRGPALAADFSHTGPGALVSAEGLVDLDPQLRDKTSLAARIVYESTSGINDSHSLVTGTVFVPKGAPPPGGWRIVAFAHPATGIQSPCAPSGSPTLLGSAPDVAALLDAGFLVTATDYQGLGLRDTDHSTADPSIGPYNGYHPFLDSMTEGYDVIDAVRAARTLVPAASKSFAAYGIGQGGQAAWAADELAADYRGGLDLVGVAAVRPTAALGGLADAAANGTLNRDQQTTLQQFLAALSREYDDFHVDAYRHGVVKDQWDVLSACWGPALEDRANVVNRIGPDDLRPDGDDATEVLRGYLQKTSLPQAPAASPMLIVPEAPDGVIPPEQAAAAVDRACAMGDAITFGTPDTDPIGWLTDRFQGVAARSDCPAPAAS